MQGVCLTLCQNMTSRSAPFDLWLLQVFLESSRNETRAALPSSNYPSPQIWSGVKPTSYSCPGSSVVVLGLRRLARFVATKCALFSQCCTLRLVNLRGTILVFILMAVELIIPCFYKSVVSENLWSQEMIVFCCFSSFGQKQHSRLSGIWDIFKKICWKCRKLNWNILMQVYVTPGIDHKQVFVQFKKTVVFESSTI